MFRSILFFAVVFSSATGLFASAMDIIFKPLLRPQFALKYTGFTSEQVENDAALRRVERDITSFDLDAPLYLRDGKGISFHSELEDWDINSNMTMPASGLAFPSSLKSYSMGLGYRQQMNLEGWTIGGSIAYASASDEVYQDSDTSGIEAMLFMVNPVGHKKAWIYGLLYNYDQSEDFPIPAIAYQTELAEGFNALLGLPLILSYSHPESNWGAKFSYIPVQKVDLTVDYTGYEFVHFDAGFNMSDRSYTLTTRQKDDDRLYVEETRLSGGMTLNFSKTLKVRVSAGQMLNQEYFISNDYSEKGQDHFKVKDAGFVQLGLKMQL